MRIGVHLVNFGFPDGPESVAPPPRLRSDP